MDENEKKTAEAPQEQPKPENYSRYMGTLNRIYRRNNNPQRKKLGDGIGSAARRPCAGAGQKRPQLPRRGGRCHPASGHPVLHQASLRT